MEGGGRGVEAPAGLLALAAPERQHCRTLSGRASARLPASCVAHSRAAPRRQALNDDVGLKVFEHGRALPALARQQGFGAHCWLARFGWERLELYGPR